MHEQGRLCRYSRQLKLNSEFYKKKELEENPIYSFKAIRNTVKKIVLLLVSANKKILQMHFEYFIFLFRSYSFGIETINTFILMYLL